MPHGKIPLNLFYYNPIIDFSDYKSEFPNLGMISPKMNRTEFFVNNISEEIMNKFKRQYHSPKSVAFNQTIIPIIHGKDEEMAQFVRKRSNRERYLMSIETTSMEKNITNFLEEQTDRDVSQVTDDEMDQALFEAQYTKPPKDSTAYKSNILQ